MKFLDFQFMVILNLFVLLLWPALGVSGEAVHIILLILTIIALVLDIVFIVLYVVH